MSEKKSFWSTIPGVITGVATVLTAVLSLIPLMNNIRGGDDATPEPTDSASASPTATSTSRANSRGSSGGSRDSAPRAVVTPKNVDFGRLGIGRTQTETVTIANTGTEYLVIEEATITGRTEVFSTEAESCLEPTGIAPESECMLTVTFAPTAAGSFAGFLDIEHSADGSPERVALNGEAALLAL